MTATPVLPSIRSYCVRQKLPNLVSSLPSLYMVPTGVFSQSFTQSLFESARSRGAAGAAFLAGGCWAATVAGQARSTDRQRQRQRRLPGKSAPHPRTAIC